MRPYDFECIILGMILRYGREAAAHVLPQLTPDKFVHGTDGEFGADHSRIWTAVRDVYLTLQREPTLTNVAAHLQGDYRTTLRSLVERLDQQYKIFLFNAEDFVAYADRVDKAGIVYNMAQVGGKLHSFAQDINSFANTANTMGEIDEWVAARMAEFPRLMSLRGSEGYQHISTLDAVLRDKWQRQFDGEQLEIMPTGMPSMQAHGLPPLGKITVAHGLSSSGKTTLAMQLLLGTAIGLVVKNTPGCVVVNSLEMEAEDLVARLASILARVNMMGFITGKLSQEELNRLYHWMDFIRQLPIYIDDTSFITTSAMQYRATGLHTSQHGPVHMLVSDYGELFDAKGDSKEQRVDSVFREQFHLARLIGAAVVAISQSASAEDKTYIAGPDATRYSRGVLQSADVVVELWNAPQAEAAGRKVIAPDKYSTAHPWLFVQKYRNGAAGAAIPLGWIPECTTFFDMSIPQALGKETVFTHLDEAVQKLAGAAW